MEFIIRGLHIELTPALKQFVEERIREKVERHTDRILQIEVMLDRESRHHEQGLERVRIVAWVPSGTKTRDGKKRLTVESTAETLHLAINDAAQELLRRLHDWLDEQKPHRKARV